VRIDASNFALRVIVGQNPNNTIDRPRYCANKLMNSAKKNYTTIEKKSFGNDICCEEIQTLFVRK
jgi:hypothetical protein